MIKFCKMGGSNCTAYFIAGCETVWSGKSLSVDSGVPREGLGGSNLPLPRNSEAGPNSEIRGK
jgi:hypothetical protein